MKLGINGLGRIGKLTLWNQIAKKNFDGIVVNIGRQVGNSLEDLVSSIERDSTYGRLGSYLHGYKCPRVISELNEETGSMIIDGVPVTILREARNPADIKWAENGIKLVVDSTGAFKDPTTDASDPRGAMRGHIQAGAEKVILSAPFKIKSKGLEMPDDAITAVMGINEETFDPAKHSLISAASCTTTCLSYMMKPLLESLGSEKILSASMVTVHAATGSQQVLDRLPAAGAVDMRKNRSIMNNIILTTTGAASALGLVIPEMSGIGFMAESVRVPTSSGSLIILVLNIQDNSEAPLKRADINGIYKKYAENTDYLVFTEEQNVSSDIVGTPSAAATIEGTETHTRTAAIKVDLRKVPGAVLSRGAEPILNVPMTQTVIYGWYDNELGSYTNMLADLTKHVSEEMF
ncbi:glyceraldehyde-3-phosphate dehydrogenase [Desulforhopalus vacuolatus]|uniref:type I glyceraldehyde-3-phosphate dehydrogenase n=1 Tax=Desulforhopalus vacuolatus TaxID=40414 RepID=UPI0019651160|nr:glyceraldehyde 3-phosphate dehydrogenase NAD-binding domain-containing protein [Desulforhopalus vacuolatus]MBM9518395.1 glyceraldehyde-3-phosphate dehydrogenase [Desulforhopalus vacuolatus]